MPRAVENSIYFVRGNNVTVAKESSIQGYDGIGYGDSYVIDPHGEILTRSRRHVEDMLVCEIAVNQHIDRSRKIGASLWSAREFGPFLREAMREAGIKEQGE